MRDLCTGSREFQMRLSTRVFTNGTTDITPAAWMTIDLHELRELLYDEVELEQFQTLTSH